MSDSLQDFLAARLPLPGLAAYGSRLADRSLTNQCYASWLKPAQVEQTLTRLELAAGDLPQHNLRPVRLCWVFEHLRIHVSVRPDGACLALFVENRPDLDRDGMDSLLDEFANIPAAG